MTDMRYTCGRCGLVWRMSDYKEDTDAHDGYNCPKCGSEDISGEDI